VWGARGLISQPDCLSSRTGKTASQSPDLFPSLFCPETIDDTDRLTAMQNHAFALAQHTFNWKANGRQFVEAVRAARAERVESQQRRRFSA
jgi:hypothetical protein